MCGESVCEEAAQFVAGAATDSKGNPIPVRDAGRRLNSLLRKTRKTAAGDPLGVLVSADIELLGLRNEEILLRWEIWRPSGQRLSPDWLSRNVAYRLTASAEEDATSQEFWVPIPKGGGSFYVKLTLTADGSNLASGRSPNFR
jgi:hypothetical protein